MKSPRSFLLLRPLLLLPTLMIVPVTVAADDDIVATVRPAEPVRSGAVAADEGRLLDEGYYQTRDGSLFAYRKWQRDGRDLVSYRRGSLELDIEGMRAYEEEHAPPVVEPALLAQAAASEDTLTLLVWLDERPARQAARAVRADHAGRIEALLRGPRAIHQDVRATLFEQDDPARALAERLAAGTLFSPAERATLRAHGERLDELRAAMRTEIAAHIREKSEAGQAAIHLAVEARGGRLLRAAPGSGTVVIELVADRLGELANEAGIRRIEALPTMRPELDNQFDSLGVDTGFAANGIAGGSFDVGVLDTGVQQDHPNLVPGQWLSMAGTTDADGHGTGVAGVILSDDATFPGLAPGIDAMLVGSADALNVMADAEWMVSTAPEDADAINLSAGYGTADDVDYSAFDQFWDGLVDDFDITVCTSAGDGGAGTTTITHPASAYNVITVGDMDDFDTVSRSNDRISTSTSRGPTLAGRKKPDLVAPGASTVTTNAAWATEPDFMALSGSSLAAPKCTAAAVLLQDQLDGADARAVKALLINSADAWNSTSGQNEYGIEWNPDYGWGYLDLHSAWLYADRTLLSTLSGPSPGTESGVGVDGETFRFFRVDFYHLRKATVVWNRHLAGNGTPEELTDLDVIVYNRSGDAEIASSTSRIDNVEQVGPEIFEPGGNIVKVKLFGSIDPDVGTETFAFACDTTCEALTAPSFVVSGSADPSPGRPFQFVADIANQGGVPSGATLVTLMPPPGYTALDGTERTLSTVLPGNSRQALYQVDAPCSTDAATLDLGVSSSTWGETFTGSGSLVVTPSTTPLVDDTPFAANTVERTFTFPRSSFFWTAVALSVNSSNLDADRDLTLDDDLCGGSPNAQSVTVSDELGELAMVSGPVLGAGQHQAMVSGEVSDENYVVEADRAQVIQPGTAAELTFDAGEFVEAFQVPMKVGFTYAIRVTGGPFHPSTVLFGFRADRAGGGRGDADVVLDMTEIGSPRFVEVTPSVGGTWGFALLKNFIKSFAGAVTVEVSLPMEALFADGFESADTSAWSQTVP